MRALRIHIVYYFIFLSFPILAQNASDPLLVEPNRNISTTVIPLSNGMKIVKKNNQYGLLDISEKLILPFYYKYIGWSDQTTEIHDDYIGYKNNDLWGYVNLKNNKKWPAIYSILNPYIGQTFIAAKRQKGSIQQLFGVIEANGKVVISFKYNNLQKAGNHLIASKLIDGKNQYGLINEKDQVVIPFKYNKIFAVDGNFLSVENQDNSQSLFNVEGLQLTGFEFSHIDFLDDVHFTVEVNGKQGIIDHTGNIIIKPEYKKIEVTSEGKIRALEFSKWSLLEEDNSLIKALYYDTISFINKKLLKASINKKEFIIDLKDNPILPLKERIFGDFYHGHSIIKEGDHYGVMNYEQQVIPVEFDSIFQSNNFFITRKQVSKDHQWFVYDGSGNRINSISYDQITPMHEGLFGVKKNGLWGYMNEFGREVINAQYDQVYPFQWGMAKVFKRQSFGVIDQYGRWIVPAQYDDITIVNSELILLRSNFYNAIFHKFKGEVYKSHYLLYVENNHIIERTNSGNLGLFDKHGQRILKSEYDQITVALADTIHLFGIEESLGILTLNGGILIGPEEGLEEVGQVNNDFIGIKLQSKYGFIDFNAKLRIANRYDSIGSFSENLAPIYLLNKWGYIDKIERIRIQPKYDFAGKFESQNAIVGRKGKYGIVNREGQEILKLAYEKIERNKFGNYYTVLNEKSGVVQKDGYELIYPRYDYIEDLGDNHFIICHNGKYGLIVDRGISTIPTIYDKLVFNKEYNFFFAMEKGNWVTLTL